MNEFEGKKKQSGNISSSVKKDTSLTVFVKNT